MSLAAGFFGAGAGAEAAGAGGAEDVGLDTHWTPGSTEGMATSVTESKQIHALVNPTRYLFKNEM